uniref:Uncharacterized protein n=1 Tax=Schistocephalus solidus TaxID=70667 RepID=A0A0X3NPH0_SCHSO
MVAVLVVLILTGVVLIIVLLALACAYGCRGKTTRRHPLASVLATPSVETLQLPESVVRPPPFNPNYAPTPILGRTFEPPVDSERAPSSLVTTVSPSLPTSHATTSSAILSHAPSAPLDSFPPSYEEVLAAVNKYPVLSSPSDNSDPVASTHCKITS